MKSESDDWIATTNITRPEANLLDEIDELRREQPILYMLITGTKTATSMAKLLSQPREHIQLQLRTYKGEGLCYDEEGPRSVYWFLQPRVNHHLDTLKEWIEEQNKRGGLFNPVEESQD